jgi:hypothetical protein
MNTDVSKEHTATDFKGEGDESITLEDAGSMFLQNIGFYLQSCKVPNPRRLQCKMKALFAYAAGKFTCLLSSLLSVSCVMLKFEPYSLAFSLGLFVKCGILLESHIISFSPSQSQHHTSNDSKKCN